MADGANAVVVWAATAMTAKVATRDLLGMVDDWIVWDDNNKGIGKNCEH